MLPMTRDAEDGQPEYQSMANTRIVELRLRELSQLFDPLDPSSPDERDLNHRVEEFIVESLKEAFSDEVRELVVHFDKPIAMPDEEHIVVNAIRNYFTRRAKYFQLSLHKLIRRGLISLGIGLAFLGVFFLIGRILVHLWGENAFTTVLTESLIIGGWVAMWRPLEIFLYDWWPILGERRLYERLSHIQVRIDSEKSRLVRAPSVSFCRPRQTRLTHFGKGRFRNARPGCIDVTRLTTVERV
jgi:hypothetical protein